MAILVLDDFTNLKFLSDLKGNTYTNDADLKERVLAQGDTEWIRLKKQFKVSDDDALTDPTSDPMIKQALIQYVLWKWASDKVGNKLSERLNGSTYDPWEMTKKSLYNDYDDYVGQINASQLYEDSDNENNSNTSTGDVVKLNYGM